MYKLKINKDVIFPRSQHSQNIQTPRSSRTWYRRIRQYFLSLNYTQQSHTFSIAISKMILTRMKIKRWKRIIIIKRESIDLLGLLIKGILVLWILCCRYWRDFIGYGRLWHLWNHLLEIWMSLLSLVRGGLMLTKNFLYSLNQASKVSNSHHIPEINR